MRSDQIKRNGMDLEMGEVGLFGGLGLDGVEVGGGWVGLGGPE